MTLRQHHRLRGCVGTLTATEPLVMAVADRAKAAAFDDPRFPGVRLGDLADLEVSVSVLSAPEPMAAAAGVAQVWHNAGVARLPLAGRGAGVAAGLAWAGQVANYA